MQQQQQQPPGQSDGLQLLLARVDQLEKNLTTTNLQLTAVSLARKKEHDRDLHRRIKAGVISAAKLVGEFGVALAVGAVRWIKLQLSSIPTYITLFLFLGLAIMLHYTLDIVSDIAIGLSYIGMIVYNAIVMPVWWIIYGACNFACSIGWGAACGMAAPISWTSNPPTDPHFEWLRILDTLPQICAPYDTGWGLVLFILRQTTSNSICGIIHYTQPSWTLYPIMNAVFGGLSFDSSSSGGDCYPPDEGWICFVYQVRDLIWLIIVIYFWVKIPQAFKKLRHMLLHLSSYLVHRLLHFAALLWHKFTHPNIHKHLEEKHGGMVAYDPQVVYHSLIEADKIPSLTQQLLNA